MNHHTHALAWFEIPVADLGRARRFYETIFATHLTPLDIGIGLSMALFPAAEGGIGGALCRHPDFYHPGQQGALVYLNGNPDLQAVLDRVPAAGGKVILPKRQISAERGFMALIEDTEGNRVGLHSGK